MRNGQRRLTSRRLSRRLIIVNDLVDDLIVVDDLVDGFDVLVRVID